MAENQIINLLINARQNVSGTLLQVQKGIKGLGNSIDEANRKAAASQSSLGRELQDTDRRLKSNIATNQKRINQIKSEIPLLDKRNTTQREWHNQLVKEQQDLVQSVNVSKERRRNIAGEIDALAGNTKATRRLANENKGLSGTYGKLKRSLEDNNTTLGRTVNAWKRVRSEAANNNTAMGRFLRTSEELRKENVKLERTLGRLSRAFRGLAIVGVLGFLQSFNSILVGLGGQVVALGGSLVSAGAALGGAFVAGISQAIPVVGIFLAVVQRLSAVMNAVNEHFLVQKQDANSSSSALEAQHNAANQVADAQRAIGDAERGVADARRGVADANRNVVLAEHALTQARQDAKREVEDLLFAERAEELQLKQSLLSRKEAQQALEDALKSGADPQEIESLRLQLKQASLDVEQQRTSAKRAAQDADEARRKGIKGVDSYKSAQQSLADALRSTKDAHRGVADAERQLAQANRTLAESHRDAATAAKDQTAAEGYLKYFIQQLTPAEKELYHSIVRVKNFLQTQFTDVTDPIIKSFSRGINRGLEFIRRPQVFNSLKKLGRDLGDAFDSVTKFFTNRSMERFLTFVIREASRNLPTLVEAFKVLARIFKNIAIDAAPVLSKFLGFIVNQLKQFNQLLTNRRDVEEFFSTGFRFFRSWFGVIKGLLDLIGALIGVSQSSAFQTLHAFAETLHGAADSLRANRSAAKGFFEDTARTLSTIGEMILSIGSAMVQAFSPDSVEDLAVIVDTVIAPGLGLAVQLIGKFADILSTVVRILDHFQIAGHNILELALAFKLTLGTARLLSLVIAGPLIAGLGRAFTLIKQIGAAMAALRAGSTIGGAISAAQGAGGGGLLNAFKKKPTGMAAGFGSELSTASKGAGTASALAFATAFKVALVGAIAAIGIGNVVLSATKGDWRGVGAKAGGLIVGAIAGFIASGGNPIGAAIGGALGSIGAGALLDALTKLFHPTSELQRLQDSLAASSRGVAVAMQNEAAAVRGLKDASLSLREAHLNEKQAHFAVIEAKREYNRVSDHGRKHDLASKEALLALKQARVAERRATDDENNSRREQIRQYNKLLRQQGEGFDNAVTEIQTSKAAIASSKEKIKHDKQIIANTEGIADRTGKLTRAENDLKDQRQILKTATQGLNTSQDQLVYYYNQQIKFGKQVGGKIGQDIIDKARQGKRAQEDFGDKTKYASQKLDDQRVSSRKTSRGLGSLIDTLFGTGKQSENLGDAIKEVTNKVLKSFGVKELHFDIGNVAKKVGGALGGASSFLGSLIGGQTGGYFGSPNERGEDDRIIKVAGGEAILTGWHQGAVNTAMKVANMMGFPYDSLSSMFGKDKREHKSAPGYARGGMIDPGWDPGSELLNSQISSVVGGWAKKYHANMTAGYDPGGGHVSPGHNITGTATDMVPLAGWTKGSQKLFEAGLSALVKANIGPIYYGSRYVPGTQNLEGHGPPALAGGNAHAHIEWGNNPHFKGAGGLFGGLPHIKIKGPKGPLRDALQGQADALRKAADHYISQQMPASAGLAGDFTAKGGGTLSKAQFQQIARKAIAITGAKGFTTGGLLALALQESGLRVNPPPPHDSNWPDNPSMGLMQVTGDTFKAYHQPGTSRNIVDPLANIAASINYQIARYHHQVTSSPYAKGGLVPAFDQGGVVPGPRGSSQIIEAHGGETILPTHKYQGGGFVERQLRETLHDVTKEAQSIKHGGHLQKVLEGLTKLLRDGGLFDRLAELIDVYTTDLARKLTEWAYKIRKGLVSQVKTNIQIANKSLDNLETVGHKLNHELDDINKLLRITHRKIRNADNADQKKKLKASLRALQTQANEVQDALAQNMTDRLDAQRAIFEAFMSRIEQRLSINDLRLQISQARGELSGNVDTDQAESILETRGDILQKQRREIRHALRQATRRHDTERRRELELALLENKLALLENTKSLKELQGTANKIINFNSTAWELFRVAIFNGMGGVLPQFNIPSLATGGYINKEGIYHLHQGETVVPGDQEVGKMNNTIYITEPMEVADPVALSNAIGMKLKTSKAVNR